MTWRRPSCSRKAAAWSRYQASAKKTAERLLLELKGKLGADISAAGPASARSDAQLDILQALLTLGYSEKEAQATLKTLPADIKVSEGIKQALKMLAK